MAIDNSRALTNLCSRKKMAIIILAVQIGKRTLKLSIQQVKRKHKKNNMA